MSKSLHASAAAIALAAVFSIAPLEANAATIRALTIATDTTTTQPPERCDQFSTAPTVSCSVSDSTAGATTNASAYANATTGEMGVYVENSGYDFSTQATASILEGFTVTTGGTFTFSVLLEGMADIFDNDPVFEPAESFQVSTTLVVQQDDIFGPVKGTTGYRAPDILQQSVDQTRSMSLLLDPGHYVFQADLLAFIGAGTRGTLDFIHTASIFMETLDGAFTFDTAGFLSNPAFLDEPSEVPLPAAFPLMLAGLAGLSLAGRRRRISQIAV
ncbi:MAG: VPLPA-CTERM sorting domain-containing protein [Bryobacterales bacterium]